MFPNSILANGEQLVYATAYGTVNGDGPGSLPQGIAAVIRRRMQTMNIFELVDVQVTNLNGPPPIEDEAGVLLTLRVRTKGVPASDLDGGMIIVK